MIMWTLFPGRSQGVHVEKHTRYSPALKRIVTIDVFLPPKYYQKSQRYPILFFNDGQDMGQVRMRETLDSLYKSNSIQHIVLVGVHANERRLQEYGTASAPDYKGRGGDAGVYTRFVLNELIPYLQDHYRINWDPKTTGFAGFSLGGLSAFDISWNQSNIFGLTGVFSGSFWWRWTDETLGGDPEAARIMHKVVRETDDKPGLRMWFEAGTNDEKEDRNNNGIIDAIEDTLDLISELSQKGYKMGTEIHYVEVPLGEHNPKTWAKVMPKFLTWAYGRRSYQSL